jgi:hypothetical protein
MSKITISIILTTLLLGIGSLQAQNMIPKKCYFHLMGTVDKEYQIEMNLIKINDTIYGDYSMTRQGKALQANQNNGNGISVYGRMSIGNEFILKELNEDKGNVFKGKFVNSQNLSGTMEGPGMITPLPFELTEKYPEGSIAMDVYYEKASTPIVKKPKSPVALIQLALLLPTESANPLISDSLIHLVLTKFTGKPIRMSQPEKLLEGMKQIYFENYISTNESIYKESMAANFNWQSLKFTHILLNGSHMFSFYIDHFAFTGGAHGLQSRQYTVVNLWNGKEVMLKDLFKQNSDARLTSILNDKLHEMNHLSTSQSLKDAGFYSDTITPIDNFYVTREGIGFYYNQYNIAAYAIGAVNIFLPFRDLKEVLNINGPIRELLK